MSFTLMHEFDAWIKLINQVANFSFDAIMNDTDYICEPHEYCLVLSNPDILRMNAIYEFQSPRNGIC